MHVDIAGVAKAATVAAGFDWRWSADDLPRFCAAAGWQVADERPRMVRLTTNLDVERPAAAAIGSYHTGDDGQRLLVEYVTLTVADIATESAEVLAGSRTEISARLTTELGPGHRIRSGARSALTWERPAVTIRVVADEQSIALEFANPHCPAPPQQRGSADPHVGADDWPRFTTALAHTLSRMPYDGFLVLSTVGNRYAQFRMRADRLFCEIVGNDYLDEEFRVSPADETTMAETGWRSGTGGGDANWHLDIELPASFGVYDAAAARVTVALRDILRVPTPDLLELRTWVDDARWELDSSLLTAARQR
ncbi:DUF6301 family protein [Nocardia sp. NPDC052566]|uniref:DUF6301 family protein n=1 Tax=Nocardia sp. NPDC052566 TaxID=3364330 RepID=UPI0037C90880